MLVTASGLIEAPVKVLEKLEVVGMEIERLPAIIHKNTGSRTRQSVVGG